LDQHVLACVLYYSLSCPRSSCLLLSAILDLMERPSDCYHALRLFELSKQERARSHQSASSSSSHDFSLGGKSQSKPVWDAAVFGPTGLLPGQSHTPTRIGRDLHELVAQHDQERQAGECCLWKLCPSALCTMPSPTMHWITLCSCLGESTAVQQEKKLPKAD